MFSAARKRICDLGYLREAYRTERGDIGFRCPAEPISAYVAKGGDAAETEHRKCICNGLLAAAGYPQIQSNRCIEPGVITAGDDLAGIRRFMTSGTGTYSAADVISALLAGVSEPVGTFDSSHEEIEA